MEQAIASSVQSYLLKWVQLTVVRLANRGHGIRLYRDEAARLAINDSIRLPDDSFAVILSVHHNLHCLVSDCEDRARLALR